MDTPKSHGATSPLLGWPETILWRGMTWLQSDVMDLRHVTDLPASPKTVLARVGAMHALSFVWLKCNSVPKMSQKDAQVQKAKQLHDAIEKMTEDRRFRRSPQMIQLELWWILESKHGTNDISNIHFPHHLSSSGINPGCFSVYLSICQCVVWFIFGPACCNPINRRKKSKAVPFKYGAIQAVPNCPFIIFHPLQSLQSW